MLSQLVSSTHAIAAQSLTKTTNGNRLSCGIFPGRQHISKITRARRACTRRLFTADSHVWRHDEDYGAMWTLIDTRTRSWGMKKIQSTRPSSVRMIEVITKPTKKPNPVASISSKRHIGWAIDIDCSFGSGSAIWIHVGMRFHVASTCLLHGRVGLTSRHGLRRLTLPTCGNRYHYFRRVYDHHFGAEDETRSFSDSDGIETSKTKANRSPTRLGRSAATRKESISVQL